MKHPVLKAVTTMGALLLLAIPMSQVSAQQSDATKLMSPEELTKAIEALKVDKEHCNQPELNRLTINLIALTQAQLINNALSADLFVKITNTSIECQNAKLIEGPGGQMVPVPPKAQ